MASERPHVRPRFSQQSDVPADVLCRRLKAALRSTKEISGLVLERRVELVPTAADQHFFSPQLTLDVHDKEDLEQNSAISGSTLQGRFGPHPNVWTLYVAIHGLGAIATLGAGIYGLSQHLSGQTPWALWALPAAPVLAALVWALAFVGQSLGAAQMYQLRQFVDSVAQTAVPQKTAVTGSESSELSELSEEAK